MPQAFFQQPSLQQKKQQQLVSSVAIGDKVKIFKCECGSWGRSFVNEQAILPGKVNQVENLFDVDSVNFRGLQQENISMISKNHGTWLQVGIEIMFRTLRQTLQAMSNYHLPWPSETLHRQIFKFGNFMGAAIES